MPLRKQPKSLVDIAICESAQVIFKLCVQIESEWGDYNGLHTRAKVQTLQNHLLETIPYSLFDRLYERRSQNLEYELRDHRILLGVYLHSNLRSLSSLSASLRAIGNDDFWLEVLPNLKNLVELDFKLTCTDEILKIVGENCPKLESMNCVSKMTTVNRNSPNNINFNALRVELYVSDEGLSHLSKCKRLKKVTMNRKINSLCAGKKPTIEGIRNLVRTLPMLQCLTFDDLGSVISEGMENCQPLSLIQLSDTHPTRDHMLKIAKLCPNLKELFLIRPINANNANLDDSRGRLCCHDKLYDSDVLSALASTDLSLELLGLKNLLFDDNLINCLRIKGQLLTSLQLDGHCDQITSQEILLIGECCPNLVGLHLFGLGAEKRSIDKLYFMRKPTNVFKKLNCISLGGGTWDPFIILPMFLMYAPNLIRISLFRDCKITLDELFMELMTIHKFQNLKVLDLFRGCFITFNTLQSFIFHCPVLQIVKVMPSCDLTRTQVDDLVKELTNLNYDIIVSVHEGFKI